MTLPTADLLRNRFLLDLDLLHNFRGREIPEDVLSGYVRLGWLADGFDGLHLTASGAAVCDALELAAGERAGRRVERDPDIHYLVH